MQKLDNSGKLRVVFKSYENQDPTIKVRIIGAFQKIFGCGLQDASDFSRGAKFAEINTCNLVVLREMFREWGTLEVASEHPGIFVTNW